MMCKCGGILDVIRIEKPPENMPEAKKIVYDRLCDVECMKCGTVYFSQPYDPGNNINIVRGKMKPLL
jgi:hypothetical protein